MTKLLLIAFLLALKTNCVVSAARTRVLNLSVGNGKATKAANPFPKLTKRQKAGREIDRSFLVSRCLSVRSCVIDATLPVIAPALLLTHIAYHYQVDLLDPDSNHHDYFSMSMAFTEASSPSPSPEPSPAPTPSPTGGPSQATATDHPSSAPSQETDEPSFGPTQDDAICYCAPNTYEFTLDFALTCPGDISTGGGVQDFSCFISPFANSEVTDLVPVAIQSINVIELDQNLQLLAQESIERDFGDGDTFQYTSVAAFPGTTSYTEDAPTNIPRAIQLNINGINQNGEGIINVFIIVFTNSCDVYPVLFEGESIGWTTFVSGGIVFHGSIL
jgi:hypothetical protein